MLTAFRFYFKALIAAALIFGPYWPAFAQNQSTVTKPLATADAAGSSVYKPKQARSDDFNFKLLAGIEQISYGSSSVYDNGSLQQVETEFVLSKRGLFFTNTDIVLGTYSLENSFYYAAPEVYAGYGTKNLNVTLGRKIDNYSFADEYFNFGLIQPYFTNDFLNFRTNGLTGLSLHHHQGSFGFNIGYNPVFLPNQAPQVKIENGDVSTTNRWATVPPQQIRLGDENREIIYAIQDYNISDVVNNPGYIANMYFGENKARPLISATYARQPINDIALSREAFADIATFHGNVILNPVVLNHQVYAADLNVDVASLKMSLSYLGDKPENKPAKELETMQDLAPLSIVSAYIGYDLSSAIGQKMEVYAAAANITGGEIRDLNSNGQAGSVNYASSRTLFKRPVKVGAKGEIFYIQNRAFNADVNVTYDQQLKGSLLSAVFSYAVTKTVNLNAGVDVLGVENEASTSSDSNFLEQNKANDRVMAGVNYVF
jgi:hypothetical protein